MTRAVAMVTTEEVVTQWAQASSFHSNSGQRTRLTTAVAMVTTEEVVTQWDWVVMNSLVTKT